MPLEPNTMNCLPRSGELFQAAAGELRKLSLKAPPPPKDDPRKFRDRLWIEVGTESLPLGLAMEPWQRRDFEAMDAGWMNVAGYGPPVGFKRAYLERPRGHSKTSDIGVMAAYALWSAERGVRGLVGSGNQEQAGYIRDAIQKLLSLNPWLNLRINNWEVKNPRTKSELTIMASDADTSFGPTPDFMIADELTHWPKGKGPGFWTALFSSAAKKPNCLFAVIANAGKGMGKSWQWMIREQARLRPDWYYASLDGPQASWITEAALEEQRAILVPAEFNRLFLNRWSVAEGSPVDPNDVAACVVLSGPDEAKTGCPEFIAGLDLGLKKDHAAWVVWGVDPWRMKLRLVKCCSWKPGEGSGRADGQIDLQAVLQEILLTEKETPLAAIYFDPHQAGLMNQILQDHGLNTIEMTFTGKNCDEIARALVRTLKNREIELYDDQQLLRDFSRLDVVEKEYGIKLESVSDEHGHADRAIAAAIALPRGLKFLQDCREIYCAA